MTRATARQRAACRRAAKLARWLCRLVDGDTPPAAVELRFAMASIDRALAEGLGLDCRADPDLTYRRGHARNLALVLRRSIQRLRDPDLDRAGRAELLAAMGRLSAELAGTVRLIMGRVEDVEALLPVEPWTATLTGRLLALTARLLPPELRREFIEDQCGNLASAASRREWAAYLLDLLTGMPRVAAAARPGRERW